MLLVHPTGGGGGIEGSTGGGGGIEGSTGGGGGIEVSTGAAGSIEGSTGGGEGIEGSTGAAGSMTLGRTRERTSSEGDTSMDRDENADTATQDSELMAWLTSQSWAGDTAGQISSGLESLRYPGLAVNSWLKRVQAVIAMLWELAEAQYDPTPRRSTSQAPSLDAPAWLLRLLYVPPASLGRPSGRYAEEVYRRPLNDDVRSTAAAWNSGLAKRNHRQRLKLGFSAQSFFRVPLAAHGYDGLLEAFYDVSYKGAGAKILHGQLEQYEAQMGSGPTPSVMIQRDGGPAGRALSAAAAPSLEASSRPLSQQPAEAGLLGSQPDSPAPFHGRSMILLQSSGTGKSRLLHELGKLPSVFLFALCLCPEDRQGGNGFPLGDPAGRTFLLEETKDEEVLALRYACFFSAFFQVAHQRMTGLPPSERRAWWLSLSDHASASNPSASPGPRRAFEDRLAERDAFVSTVVDVAEDRLCASQGYDVEIDSARAMLQELQGELPKGSFFIIGVDEASKLSLALKGVKVNEDFASLSMRRCWLDLDVERAWLVMVDTNSALTHLAPQFESSHRLVLGLMQSLPPYTDLPLNVMMTPAERSSTKVAQETPLELASLARIVRMGRPLWSSLSIKNDGALPRVLSKVMGPSPGDEERLLQHRAMGILSQRLEFDLRTQTQDARQLVERQVHFHLRYIDAITPDRAAILTRSTPEPLPSFATSVLLREVKSGGWETCSWAQALRGLRQAYGSASGLLDIGHGGEMVAQAVMCMAYDRADRSDTSWLTKLSSTTRLLVGETFVSLSAFLDSLLTIDRNVAAGTASSALQDLHQALGSGYIRFSRFVRAFESYDAITVECLLEAWMGGVAWLGAPQQRDWDLVIPVYCGDLKKPMDKSRLTAIAVQVKSRAQAAPSQISTTWPTFLAEQPPTRDQASSDAKRLPFIFCWLDLGLSRASALPRQRDNVQVTARRSPRTPKSSSESLGTTAAVDHFLVVCSSLGPETFRCLQHAESASLRAILQRDEAIRLPLPSRHRLLLSDDAQSEASTEATSAESCHSESAL